ncbi:MAG TPA: hypothetical protein VIC08_09720 [Cellvibrionaceae bacterium]
MINSALARHSHSGGGLTELVLTDNSPQQEALIFSMAAHLSQQQDDRWLTWITSDRKAASRLQGRTDINMKALRLVYCGEPEDHLWMAWDALTLGNSHTVIASPGRLQEKAFSELERAAIAGSSQGILLRTRRGDF